jgi:hypothetical protein
MRGRDLEEYVYALVRRGLAPLFFWRIRHILAEDFYGYRYGLTTAVLVGVIAINVLVFLYLFRK